MNLQMWSESKTCWPWYPSEQCHDSRVDFYFRLHLQLPVNNTQSVNFLLSPFIHAAQNAQPCARKVHFCAWHCSLARFTRQNLWWQTNRDGCCAVASHISTYLVEAISNTKYSFFWKFSIMRMSLINLNIFMDCVRLCYCRQDLIMHLTATISGAWSH